LQLQRDHYKVFFDTSREGMYCTTREGYFIDANLAFCQLLGFSRPEILRRHVEDILALPGERRRFRHEIEAQGAVTGFRIKLLNKAGDEVACQIHAVVLRDFEGQVDGYIGMVRPLKAIPEASLFTLALRGSQDGHWEWDLKKNEVEYSARWKALVGYGAFELGRSVREWFDRVHPEDLTTVMQTLQGGIQGQTPSVSAYFRMRHKDGTHLWMLVRGIGEFDEAGRCLKLAGSLSNITAHIKMVEGLKQQEEALEQANETLAHDKALLARFFSGDVLSRILAGGSGQTRETVGNAAILQVRVNRIQGLWHRIGPQAYASFLNDLLTDLMDLVYGRGGSVNKILGDTLLVSFGAPLAQEDDLEKAVLLAQDILEYRKTFNDGKPDWLPLDLVFSMGLGWGEVFSGTLGSVHRLEYTLVGLAVTRAALLQQTAEKAGIGLLIDDPVRAACGLRFPFVPAVAPVPRGADRKGPNLAGLWTLG